VSGDDDEVGARGICPEDVNQIHLREIRGPSDEGLCGGGRITADDSFEIDAFFLKQPFLLGDQKRPIRSSKDDIAVVDRREPGILLRLTSGGRREEQEQPKHQAVCTSKTYHSSSF